MDILYYCEGEVHEWKQHREMLDEELHLFSYPLTG